MRFSPKCFSTVPPQLVLNRDGLKLGQRVLQRELNSGSSCLSKYIPSICRLPGCLHCGWEQLAGFWGVGELCCSLSEVAELHCPSLQLQGSGSDRGGVICMQGGIFQWWESQQIIARNSSGGVGIDS